MLFPEVAQSFQFLLGKSPLQIVGNDYPAGYEHTKDAFYIHIKLLWGLIEKNAVPSAPDPLQLNEFYQHFSTPYQIKSALSKNGPPLVPFDTVQTLFNACQKHTKVGKYFINLSEFSIIYVCSSLSKLGIQTWAPNLYEQPDSFYNEACRINDESSEGTESDYGESFEMETSDDEEEEYGSPNNESDEIEAVKGKGREAYRKYDEDEEAMEIETSGRGGYYGGLTEEEWEQWQ
ncbi:hypothetical protein O181_011706 [Austropuccinia psidii MF-1]|uniref:Uncharacterized protein n=1 Tax=Austropuccinia psidii MF-1 TaxID=1389203 RepID=A0A9Q3BT92_9BASI|nr:hypothetical protein [Austropuccinia psidii MF-1]